MISDDTKPLPRWTTRARGVRNARPGPQACRHISSRRSQLPSHIFEALREIRNQLLDILEADQRLRQSNLFAQFAQFAQSGLYRPKVPKSLVSGMMEGAFWT
jgi:uncharacterized protein (DUF2336 family)